jgi:glyoxylase-like metal-dependent hydrolase (beta-lactamase superfamily II)
MPSTVHSDPEERYTVTAVRYGTLDTHRSEVFLNYADYGCADDHAALDYYFWIVRSDRRTIVLDTGFDAAVGIRRGRTVLIDPRRALEALGVDDDPATTVVISHAHYDHIGNVAHFRRSRLLMARAEFDFWIAHPRRLPVVDRLAEPAELDELRTAHRDGRLQFLDGRTEIAPGIEVVPGAGHTPGQLMLVVAAEGGRILLTSDAVHVDEELSERMPFRHMCDLEATADTYDAIDAALREGGAVRVVAGHQPGLLGRFDADPRLPDHTAVLSAPIRTPLERPHHAAQ